MELFEITKGPGAYLNMQSWVTRKELSSSNSDSLLAVSARVCIGSTLTRMAKILEKNPSNQSSVKSGKFLGSSCTCSSRSFPFVAH